MLHIDTYGDGETTLVIAHGLFGSGRNWRAIAKRLGQDMRVVTVDMRNHAGSFRSDDMSYLDMANDLADVLDSVGPARLLGHSMGGKAAMVTALQSPEKVERLIVADIAPVTYSHTQIHNIEAMEAVDLPTVTRRADADQQLADHIDDLSLRAFFLQSLDIGPDGARWLLNHAALRGAMDQILSFPEISGLYQGPALFVIGRESDYVDAHGKERIRALFSKPRFAAIKGAGHWLHADQPKAFIETVRAFLMAPDL